MFFSKYKCCNSLWPFSFYCFSKSKHEEQKLKWSIFAILTGLLCSHLPNTTKHLKHLGYFMPYSNNNSHSKVVSGYSAWIASSSYQISFHSVKKCVRKWSQEVLLCADIVTFNHGPGHWKRYKKVNGVPISMGMIEFGWKVCSFCHARLPAGQPTTTNDVQHVLLIWIKNLVEKIAHNV